MPYYLQGTKDLISYWNTLGRPCDISDLASTTGIPKINFMGVGRDKISEVYTYGEVQAQNLAAKLGTTVANVTTNGGQFQI